MERNRNKKYILILYSSLWYKGQHSVFFVFVFCVFFVFVFFYVQQKDFIRNIDTIEMSQEKFNEGSDYFTRLFLHAYDTFHAANVAAPINKRQFWRDAFENLPKSADLSNAESLRRRYNRWETRYSSQSKEIEKNKETKKKYLLPPGQLFETDARRVLQPKVEAELGDVVRAMAMCNYAMHTTKIVEIAEELSGYSITNRARWLHTFAERQGIDLDAKMKQISYGRTNANAIPANAESFIEEYGKEIQTGRYTGNF